MYNFINILRVFLPSWRFFEEVTKVPRLYYRLRLKTGGAVLTEWVPFVFHRSPRKFWHLVHNPWGNLELSYLVELDKLFLHLVEHKDSSMKDVESQPSFYIIQALVLEQVSLQHSQPFLSLVSELQFKLCVQSLSENPRGHLSLENSDIGPLFLVNLPIPNPIGSAL